MQSPLPMPRWASWALEHPVQSVRVVVDGVEVHALRWGTADRSKPSVLFVHGHRAHAHWWDFTAPFFAETHTVYAIDLSGNGDSGHRAIYPAGSGVQDIIGLVRALELSPVTLVGHSLGGLRALGACAEVPELIERAVIIDSYPIFTGDERFSGPTRVLGDRVYPDLASILAKYRFLPDQAHIEPWVLAHFARHSVKEVEGGWRWKFDPYMLSGVTQEPDAADLLQAVRCPVHFIYGGASAVVDEAMARRVVAHLPQGHGPIVVPGGHHHLMADQPAALVGMLQALLS